MSSKKKGPTARTSHEAKTHAGADGQSKPDTGKKNTGSSGAQYTDRFAPPHDEATKMYHLTVVTPNNFRALPSEFVPAVSTSVICWLRDRSRAEKPPMCLLCSAEFSDQFPAGFAFISEAHSEEPEVTDFRGICDTCMDVPADVLMTRAFKTIRKDKFTDAVVAPDGGGDDA